jgi:hypothetical protein
MQREPHSKYTHAIHSYKLTVVWNDGLVEDLTPDLPETLRNEIEQYMTDLDDLRTQNPVDYSA